MSSRADNRTRPAAPRRRHDAQASRRALLDAARELFDTRGYERTTIREIGDRAEVDAALIARYFGGKEGLYCAAVGEAPMPPPTDDPVELFERILHRSIDHELGPIGLAMVTPSLSGPVRERVAEILATRAIEPLAGSLRGHGVPDAELRAELLVATALGISLTRAGGTLPALRDAPLAAIVASIGPVIAAMCRHADAASGQEAIVSSGSSDVSAK